jgi:type IV fimbrial biogenesis protein FimT
MSKENGFTLVELMVTLAVAAILFTVGIPSFRDFIMNNRLIGNANEFAAAINLARSVAIKQQRNAYITSNSGTDWSDGWTVWVDNNGNGAQDAAEVVRVTQAMDANTTFTSAAKTRFRYSPSGLVDGPGTLTVCDSRAGETGRVIDISAAGRSNIQRTGCL